MVTSCVFVHKPGAAHAHTHKHTHTQTHTNTHAHTQTYLRNGVPGIKTAVLDFFLRLGLPSPWVYCTKIHPCTQRLAFRFMCVGFFFWAVRAGQGVMGRSPVSPSVCSKSPSAASTQILAVQVPGTVSTRYCTDVLEWAHSLEIMSSVLWLIKTEKAR